ncbi:MAG: UDP-glucose/GDP-mannose dehydrogenase family protein [Rubricoccaceae bacterium]|nr:UDP-glucose/GDP-mannose dehydrogenase family protein [Rubricoccaceae bacterium]
MNIAVVGTGYVGLVSGTCFAEMGNNVLCVDIDENKVEKLRSGMLTIFEPGLEVFFDRSRREGRLHFTTDLAEAVESSEVIFLALPTPPGEDGSADLSYVLGVAEQIADLLAAHPDWGYRVIVDKSTVPVGTARRVTAVMEASGLEAGVRFDVVSNPEFLREGVAVDDFMKPERVVVGTSSPRAGDLMTSLYEPFVRSGNPVIVMDEESAEMTKYAANALLATKITFMNEIANLCERVGADVDKVRRGIGTDSRIGPKFLFAGVGFGGSCFPKDVQALHRTAHDNAYDFQILGAVLRVNELQRRILVPRIVDELADENGRLDSRRISVWGLAFKPNTDDVREAPAHYIIRDLADLGAEVVAFDPEARETTIEVLGEGALGDGSINYTESAYDAVEDADALIICTEWAEFRRPDLVRVRRALKRPLIFDGRNVFDPERMAERGFEYHSIGRPFIAPLPVDESADVAEA